MTALMKLPRYVLRHDLAAIGPANQDPDNSQPACVIYGFSDKPDYDLFRSQDTRLLKPYPLVARFLIDELRNGSTAKQLIVLNASSPSQESVYAVGMKEVLDAFNDKLDHVEASHELKINQSNQMYQLKRIENNQPASALY
ncbi:MAG: hypothetical protein MUC43_01655 [Pirellula sp.]|nr:hypothetical protein [Pirellula sp.]